MGRRGTMMAMVSGENLSQLGLRDHIDHHG